MRSLKPWEKTLVYPKTPIATVIQKIDASHLQIALVVDSRRCLLGTVTDGDVRRGILKGIGLGEPVEKIMGKKPVVAALHKSRENILMTMKQKGIRQIPLVNEEGRVVGMEVLDTLLDPGVKDNWVLLMAGGLGTRLRPLTDDCPKPLLSVGTKPLLETILENFIEYGFKKFFFSVQYKNEMVREYFGNGSRWKVEIHYLQERKPLGTAGALSLLPKLPSTPLIVMNGDLLTKINWNQLLAFHRENELAATLCVREYDFQVPYGVVKIGRHQMKSIDEKPVQKFFVNAGIYILDPKVMRGIPKKSVLDMPRFLEKLARKKMGVATFPIREYWLDIGRLDDLERANGDFARLFKDRK